MNALTNSMTNSMTMTTPSIAAIDPAQPMHTLARVPYRHKRANLDDISKQVECLDTLISCCSPDSHLLYSAFAAPHRFVDSVDCPASRAHRAFVTSVRELATSGRHSMLLHMRNTANELGMLRELVTAVQNHRIPVAETVIVPLSRLQRRAVAVNRVVEAPDEVEVRIERMDGAPVLVIQNPNLAPIAVMFRYHTVSGCFVVRYGTDDVTAYTPR